MTNPIEVTIEQPILQVTMQQPSVVASFPGTQGVPGTPGESGVTDPVLLLTMQDYTVDTYNGSNQVTEAHREDGTTVVNTYNGNNQIQTAVYTFPDMTTRTLKLTYDGSNRLLSALWS